MTRVDLRNVNVANALVQVVKYLYDARDYRRVNPARGDLCHSLVLDSMRVIFTRPVQVGLDRLQI